MSTKSTDNRVAYFAFGSNMDPEQMAYRCPNSDYLGPATLHNYRLVFRNVADVERRKGSTVCGSLWLLPPEDLRALDRYEGYPRLYTRFTVPVRYEGATVQAIIYQMTRQRHRGYSKPSDHYYDGIARGYQYAGHDLRRLSAAVAHR